MNCTCNCVFFMPSAFLAGSLSPVWLAAFWGRTSPPKKSTLCSNEKNDPTIPSVWPLKTIQDPMLKMCIYIVYILLSSFIIPQEGSGIIWEIVIKHRKSSCIYVYIYKHAINTNRFLAALMFPFLRPHRVYSLLITRCFTKGGSCFRTLRLMCRLFLVQASNQGCVFSLSTTSSSVFFWVVQKSSLVTPH